MKLNLILQLMVGILSLTFILSGIFLSEVGVIHSLKEAGGYSLWTIGLILLGILIGKETKE